MICSNCGNESRDNAKVCGFCGTPFYVSDTAAAPPPDNTAAYDATAYTNGNAAVYTENSGVYGTVSPVAGKPKKKRRAGKIVLCVIACLLVAIILLGSIFYLTNPWLRIHRAAKNTFEAGNLRLKVDGVNEAYEVSYDYYEKTALLENGDSFLKIDIQEGSYFGIKDSEGVCQTSVLDEDTQIVFEVMFISIDMLLNGDYQAKAEQITELLTDMNDGLFHSPYEFDEYIDIDEYNEALMDTAFKIIKDKDLLGYKKSSKGGKTSFSIEPDFKAIIRLINRNFKDAFTDSDVYDDFKDVMDSLAYDLDYERISVTIVVEKSQLVGLELNSRNNSFEIEITDIGNANPKLDNEMQRSLDYYGF